MKFLNRSDKELIILSWPIFIEFLFNVMVGNVNVWMISHFDEVAVAAVGACNQFLGFSYNVYGFVTVGTQIMIAQFLGAKKHKEIPKVMNTAIFGAIGIGLLLGAIFILLPYPLLRFLNIPDDVIAIAIPYMQLYGTGTIILALNSVMLACLRTHGLTLQALIVPTIANILAVCGNYLVLFSPFGLPNFGVRGIAISGIFGQFCAGIVAIYLVKRYVKFNVLKVNFKRFSIPFLKQILKLGLPSSGESASYSGAQVVVTMIVATLGTNVLITKSYVSAITQFVFLTASALCQGNQIVIGRTVGAKDFEGAYQRGFRSMVQNVGISTSISIVTFIFITPIMHIYTNKPEIIELARWVFLVEIILEAARAVNMTLVGSLNASGDVRFPLACSLTVLWLISLPFSYLLAIVFHMGLVGVWIAYAIDESLRAMLMIYRWHHGTWRTKSLFV